MDKALLISIVVATIALPILAARDDDARRGLKRAVASLIGFNVLYAFMLRFVLPRIS